jgi:hypothetical protein
MRNFQLLAAAVIMMGALSSLNAQSTFGTIVGTVEDQAKLSIAGAEVKVRSLDDNSTHTATTGNDGAFQLLNLKAGRYEISIQKQGFSDYKVDSLALDARQTARLSATLTIASVGEVVEVSDAAPIVNTDSGTLGDTKKFTQVVQLPMNYRGGSDSPLMALVTVPGVQQDNNGNISIGGSTSSQIQYSVDGASTVNIRQNGALGNMNPSSELIAEFKVTQYNNNAEFGQVGDVTITTKSGGNAFHGSLFEYFQNSGLDSVTYGFASKAHKNFNTFGGSVSGPVSIPHVYNGKNKTFFFFDYEGNRRRFATPEQYSVPTLAMRQGDVSNLPGGAALDPTTNQPFPNNQIPVTRLSPVSTTLLSKYVPLPNYSDGVDTNANYRVQVPTPANINGYDVRIDQVINSKQQIYGRWSWKNVDTTAVNALLPSDSDHETNRNFLVSHNYSITPTLLNEARFAATYYTIKVNFPISGATAVKTLGLQGLDLSDVPNVNAFPSFNYSDGTGFTALGRDKTGTTQSQTLQFADNVSWVKGKHTMKFGVDFQRVYYYDLESFGGSDDFGQFTFNANTFSGNAFGDLLLGLPSKSYTAVSGPDVRARAYHTGLFAQDEWHATSKLTFSVGLRWQALPPFVSELGNLTAFNPQNGGVILPSNGVPVAGFLTSINACPGVNPALPCGPVERAAQAGVGNGVRAFYKGNYQPRVSFAYRPFNNNNTVIRGGFGIFTMTSLGQLSFNTTNIAQAVVTTTQNSITNGQPAFQFPSVAAPASALSLAGTGDFYQNVNLHYRDPQSAQWNFTIERQLMQDLALRVSYVGMNSYRMSQTVDLNQLPATDPAYNKLLTPYPNWGRILSSENLGFANYQALQSEVNKSLSHGLFFQASHTWAKNLSNVGGDAPTAFSPEVIYGTPVADRFNLSLNRGNVAGTRQQRVLISGIYQLPFGKNRAFLANMNKVGNALLGGWEISTVSLFQTGPYLTPITSPSYGSPALNLVYTGAYLRPDRIGSGVAANQTLSNYFNINDFNAVPAGALGNSGVGILTGPGTIAMAGGMAKNFVLKEGMKLRFEATFTNMLNHPNFLPPSVDVSSPSTFGQVTAVQSAENSGNRTGQLALRLDF